jgi:DNA-binding NarL/FixJ family response regulator
MDIIEQLSQREKQVLSYLCKGFLNKEICSELNISIDTVKKHNRNIFRKIGVRNRAEVIVHIATFYKNQFLNQHQ